MTLETVLILVFVATTVYLLGRATARTVPVDTNLPNERSTPEGPPNCGNCENFDLKLGQKIRAEHDAFNMATNFVTPARMGAQVDEDGNPVTAPDTETLRSDWDELGLCLVADEEGNRDLVFARCAARDCPHSAYKRRRDPWPA